MKKALPSVIDLMAPFKRYPNAIKAALQQCDSHPSFTTGLTKSFRKVLKALVIRCDKKNPRNEIHARYDRMAKEADVAEKTVERALKHFKELGLLIRLNTSRDETGLFKYGIYKFTAALADMLFPGKDCLHHKTFLSADHNRFTGVKEDKEEKEVNAETFFKNDQQEPPSENTEITLTAPLAAASAEFGISPGGMCALRGEATRAGHDLADVVQHAEPHLRKLALTGGRAFRYLQRMISKSDDYAAKAAQMARIASADSATDAHPTLLSEKIAEEIKLPLDLQVASTTLAIKPSGMCMLRGEATRAGHDLADVVRYAKPYIQKLALTGGRAFEYLRKLISTAADYTTKAQQAHPAPTRYHENKAINAKYVGKSFIGSDGLTYRFRGATVEILDGGLILRTGQTHHVNDLYALVEAGDLILTEFQPGQAPAPARASPAAPSAANLNGLRAALKKMNTDHVDKMISTGMSTT